MRTAKEEQLQKDVEVWKSRAEAHEENYLQMLKRIDDIVAERDELRKERDEFRERVLELNLLLQEHGIIGHHDL